MPGRFVTDEHTFLSAAAAAGAGAALNVASFKHVIVSVATDGGGDANLTVKCQGSIQDTAPTWASAASVSNHYDFIQMVDLENAAAVDGDTGFVVAGADDVRLFKVNADGLEWLNFRVTARSAGEVTVKCRAFEEK